MVAIDVSVFRPLSEATTEVEHFLSYVRDVPLLPGADRVRIPGESSDVTTQRRLAGGTPVQIFTWTEMQRLATEFSIRPPLVI